MKRIISYNEARREFPDAIEVLEHPHRDGFGWSHEDMDEFDEFWVIDGVLHFVNTLDELSDAWIDASWKESSEEMFPQNATEEIQQ
jgi:hypothetical protein